MLASAQAAHAAGALFKNVKGRQPPEFAPQPEEAEVDDFDAGDDESQADDKGLRSRGGPGEADTLAAADDARATDALEAGSAETPVAAPAEQDEPRSLIYGRFPPKPAASAPSA